MNINKRFTRWYIKKGYTFGYKFVETGKYELGMESYFKCPIWVRPLCIFFSPSIYVHYVSIKLLKERLYQELGINQAEGA